MSVGSLLPLSEAAKVLGVSERALRKRVAFASLLVAGAELGPNGKPVPLIDVARLPTADRALFLKVIPAPAPPRRIEEALARFEPEIRDIVLAEATRRAELLRLFTAITPKEIAGSVALAVVEVAEVWKLAAPAYRALYPSAERRPSIDTLLRFARRLELEGIAGLIRAGQRARSEGDGRVRPVDPRVRAELLRRVGETRGRLSVRGLFRDMRAWGFRAKIEVPGETRIRELVAAIPLSARIALQEGKRTARNRAQTFTPRTTAELKPRSIYSGDHHEFDVFVIDENDPEHKVKRPWLTAWIDEVTVACVGWHVSFTPNSQSIANAFGHAIARKTEPAYEGLCGIPERVYIDNGSDYVSARLNALFDELQIRNTHALPYNPKAKIAERFFGMVAGDFSPRQRGYCGNGKMETSEVVGQILRKHREWVKRERPGAPRPLLTMGEFKAAWEAWLLDLHRGVGGEIAIHRVNEGARWLSVVDYWAEHAAPPQLLSDRGLQRMLWPHKMRTVNRGFVQLFDGFYSAAELVHRDGQRVEVRWDPNDLRTLAVYEVGKGLLCEATRNAPMSFDPSETEWHAEKKRLKEARAQYRSSMAELTSPRKLVAAPKPAAPPPPPVPSIPGAPVIRTTRHDRPARRAVNGGASYVEEAMGVPTREGIEASSPPAEPLALPEWRPLRLEDVDD